MPVMCIKDLREALGLSQEELGRRVGVGHGAVAHWENELYLPKSRDLPSLARALGCSIDDLFCREGEPEGKGKVPLASVGSFTPDAEN